MRCLMLVLAVTAILPGKAAAAVAPEPDDIGDRIDRIRKQARDMDRDQASALAQRLAALDSEGMDSEGIDTLWHNQWNNGHHWTRWTNWNNSHWGNWGNHWSNH